MCVFLFFYFHFLHFLCKKVYRFFKPPHIRWKNENELLAKLRFDLESAAHNFKLQRIILTPQQLKECIAPQSSKKEIITTNSVVDIYNEFLEWSKSKGKKIGTVKGLTTTRNHLQEFCKTIPIAINEFTKEVYDKFVAWMMSNFKYQPNYIGCQTITQNLFLLMCQRK